MIKVLIVDDQAIVREGIRAMFGLEPGINVVGEAASGQESLQLALELSPDIVLMDVRMPEMDGLTALRQLKHRCPKCSVIMLTLYDNPDYLLRAVSAGAAGYILKDSTREELVRAVRITAEGGAVIAPSMLPQLLSKIGSLELMRDDSPSCDPSTVLTEREIQVLALIAEGYTNQQIADELVLSSTTIKTHVQNILHKLGVSDRTQAAVYAVRCRLI